MEVVKLLIALSLVLSAIGGQQIRARTADHVVGGDRGWDPETDITSWSSGRDFSVGDRIWFTYSAGKESIVELKSKQEYEACDVSNPIRMFMEGLDILPLEEEGIRYFASGKQDSCKNGLKLHVEVQPQSKPHDHLKNQAINSTVSTVAAAAPPTTPSASTHLNGLSFGLFVGLFASYLGPVVL